MRGRGGARLQEQAHEVLLCAYTGDVAFQAGVMESIRFSLLITPLKPIDLKAHWNTRYYHTDTWAESVPNLEEAARKGATVVNLHQGGALNPYINYPFWTAGEIREQTEKAHEKGMKYKLYYTVRELTNHAAELWALRALGGEVLRRGSAFRVADPVLGGQEGNMTGGPWLCEHLVEGFVPAWQQRLPDGEYDSAVAMTGLSRWHNVYLEGLSWLITQVGIDGLYLDGVGYDRSIMKRVRRTMDQAKPGCLIDFHSGNTHQPHYGLGSPISSYLELMPYVDSLWLGEMYDYEAKNYDYWLTEVSGIPFGLMGEMLQGGGNPWRGMVFGMTCRCGWHDSGDPEPIWRFWREYRIDRMRMLGWWNADCPVACENDAVKATAYVGTDRCIVAIASWQPAPMEVRVSVDAKAMGLSEAYQIIAPAIAGFQPARSFQPEEPILVEPGKGWLLLYQDVGKEAQV